MPESVSILRNITNVCTITITIIETDKAEISIVLKFLIFIECSLEIPNAWDDVGRNRQRQRKRKIAARALRSIELLGFCLR